MKRIFWLLVIITTLIWLAIAAYWTGNGTSKSIDTSSETNQILLTATPTPTLTAVPVSTLSAAVATSSSIPVATPSAEGTNFLY